MESLHLEQFQSYIVLAVGIILIIVSLFYKSTAKTLEKTGERCEGIIFKLGYNNSFGADMTSSNVKDKITVRFVTNKKELFKPR
jgi:hypothetical protein